jgi:hypothetical protein
MKRNKTNIWSLGLGDKFSFPHTPENTYQVIRLMRNGKMGEWGLLDLKTFTIGFTDEKLAVVIDTYNNCT